MKVPLTIQPNFLRARQAMARKRLLGQPIQPKVITPTIVFVQPQTPQTTANPQKSRQKHSRFPFRAMLFTFLALTSFSVTAILFGPDIYYRIFPADPIPLPTTQAGTPLGGRFDLGTKTTQDVQVPPRDENLPDGEWLIIPAIGIKAKIQETQSEADALQKGVWRVPQFGVPGERDKPIVFAAHRYGYLWWWQNGSEYWRYNSFYLLPQLQIGDQIQVIADKREYLYEVYAGEEGDKITDYNADMILYTCKFLTGDRRFFRYARLLDPHRNTQQAAVAP